MNPLCFVLIPSGKETVASGQVVDFDAVYQMLIRPAVEAAGMEPLRPGVAVTDRVIRKSLCEHLTLCDFVVSDLTVANANLFYELGLRHGLRPATTVMLVGAGGALPFDVAPPGCLRYALGADGQPTDPGTARAELTRLLGEMRQARGEPPRDVPIFQLVEGGAASDIARLKTDVFRERAHYPVAVRDKLAAARREGLEAVRTVAAGLDLAGAESGVLIDLLLSLRAVSDWQGMVDLIAGMAAPLARVTLVREQYAFALNRLGRGGEAEAVLLEIIAKRGASSETNSLLGRVYKDRWDAALRARDGQAAQGWLTKAIATYLQGFEADWRDAFPGINAVTLMELASPPDPRRLELLPVVTYAVRRRLAQSAPDYWDHATLLELAVLRKDETEGVDAAAAALAAARETWEPESTARNLRLIREARARRGEAQPWAEEIERRLLERAGGR